MNQEKISDQQGNEKKVFHQENNIFLIQEQKKEIFSMIENLPSKSQIDAVCFLGYYSLVDMRELINILANGNKKKVLELITLFLKKMSASDLAQSNKEFFDRVNKGFEGHGEKITFSRSITRDHLRQKLDTGLIEKINSYYVFFLKQRKISLGYATEFPHYPGSDLEYRVEVAMREFLDKGEFSHQGILTQESLGYELQKKISTFEGSENNLSEEKKKEIAEKIAKYDSVRSFSEGMAIVKRGGTYGYINKEGEEVIPVKYDYVWDFSEGMARVKRGDKYGLINKEGEEVIPVKYDSVGSFSEGMAIVKRGGKYGYINKEGEEVIPVKYDDVGRFSEGMAIVGKGDKYGLINKEGEEVIPVKYDSVHSFSEGMARVKRGGKYGYINKEGEEVIPVKYDDVWDFSEGMARVKKGGKDGYINKEGKEIIPVKYDDIVRYDHNYILGIIKKKNKKIIHWFCINGELLDHQELYELIQHPSSEKIQKHFQQHGQSSEYWKFWDQYHQGPHSQIFADFHIKPLQTVIQKVLETQPIDLVEDFPSKPVLQPSKFADKILSYCFPPEAIGGSSSSHSSSDYLSYRENVMSEGGDRLDAEKNNQEVMSVNPPISQLMMNLMFASVSRQARFDYDPVVIDADRTSHAEIDLTKVSLSGGEIILPHPINSWINNVCVFDKFGNKSGSPHLVNKGSGVYTLNVDSQLSRVSYDIVYDAVHPLIPEVSPSEYQTFKQKFILQYGEIYAEKVPGLSPEVLFFADSIRSLSPKQQAINIENFVRSVFFYDMKNGEVAKDKSGKDIAEQMEICKMRAIELGKNIEGKWYAGVCEDCKNLVLALSREVGLLSGVANGFLSHKESIGTKDAHTLVYIIFPGEDGVVNLFTVDGTPDGSVFSGPSLQDLEAETLQQKKSSDHQDSLLDESNLTPEQRKKLHKAKVLRMKKNPVFISLSELIQLAKTTEHGAGTLLGSAILQQYEKLNVEQKKVLELILDEEERKILHSMIGS